LALRRERLEGSRFCLRCLRGETPNTRLKGLLGRRELPQGEGLLLRPASSIHMFFMRFPIDAVWLDGDLNVLKVSPGVAPWQVAACKGAKGVVELPAGEAGRRGVQPGEQLFLRNGS
jgi:uncharacterized membrane protein (UPF0127 family)